MNQLSEKRFEFLFPHTIINDNIVRKSYYLSEKEDVEKIVDLLNEQSEKIKSLEMEIDLIGNTKLFSRRKLEEENEQMKKQLEKIPKTIRKVWLED